MPGIYTVEAVFITPLFIFLLLLVFYMSFYLRDKCTVQAAVNLASEKGSLLIGKNSNMETGREGNTKEKLPFYKDGSSQDEKAIEKEIRRLIDNNLFIIEIHRISVSIALNKIHCIIEGKTKISLFHIKTVFQRDLGTLELDSKSGITSIEFVRKMTAFLNKES